MSVQSWIILAILFVVSIFAYDFLTHKPKRTVIIPIGTKEEYSNWKAFRSDEGGFEAKFPSLPQYASTTDEESFGRTEDKVQYHVYAAQDKDGTTFLVKLIQYPESAILVKEDLLFDDVVKDMLLHNAGSKLMDTKKIVFLGIQARDFQIEAPGFWIRSRAFFAGKKLYVITVMDRNSQQLEADFTNFVTSFHLLAEKAEQPSQS